MWSLRELERAIYPNPVIDGLKYSEFPEIDDLEMMSMENSFILESDKVYISPYVSHLKQGIPFVEVYVWDYMLYPAMCKRFIICEGLSFSFGDEQMFFHYIDDEVMRGQVVIQEERWKNFCKDVSHNFPAIQFKPYSIYDVSKALHHLYFANYRSGAREICFKSGLDNIGYYIEEIPECNLIATTPSDIFNGMPMRLLRILNQSSLVCELFSSENIELCRNIYDKYSEFIDSVNVSVAQWEYLKMLYLQKEQFVGQTFNRALFNKLAEQKDIEILREYSDFFEIRTKLGDISIKLPKPEEIQSVIEKLKIFYEYKIGHVMENTKIRKRSTNESLIYSDDEYMVIMPKDAVDLCREAICQGNCLQNYIIPQASAETTILYIRRKSKPEVSFVTMEVRGGAILQVYGKYNSLPDTSVYYFVEKYAYIKNLAYDPIRLLADEFEEMDICMDETEIKKANQLMDYLDGYERRYSYPAFPCEELNCCQMTIFDFWPELCEGSGIQ